VTVRARQLPTVGYGISLSSAADLRLPAARGEPLSPHDEGSFPRWRLSSGCSRSDVARIPSSPERRRATVVGHCPLAAGHRPERCRVRALPTVDLNGWPVAYHRCEWTRGPWPPGCRWPLACWPVRTGRAALSASSPASLRRSLARDRLPRQPRDVAHSPRSATSQSEMATQPHRHGPCVRSGGLGFRNLGQVEIDDMGTLARHRCHGPRYRLRPRTRIFALRKSARAASRWRWLSCYHGSRRPGCRMSRDMGDAVGTALGAREYERARHLRIGKQICQQRALLCVSMWITRCAMRSNRPRRPGSR